MQAEPRGLQALHHGVEPERDFGQLNSGRVEVDAVDVVEGEVRLHLLKFLGVLLWVDAFAQLLLATVEVLGRELPDCLDGERA